jgi:ubiquitin-activating enzyme E1
MAALKLTHPPPQFQEVDKDLYSRTIAALGEDVVRAIASSNVLISGLNGTKSFLTVSSKISFTAITGLGCEIAKNVLLGGVKSLTLHDTKNAALMDLSSHFFLTEQVCFHLGM